MLLKNYNVIDMIEQIMSFITCFPVVYRNISVKYKTDKLTVCNSEIYQFGNFTVLNLSPLRCFSEKAACTVL
jgi:hypothetical protein